MPSIKHCGSNTIRTLERLKVGDSRLNTTESERLKYRTMCSAQRHIDKSTNTTLSPCRSDPPRFGADLALSAFLPIPTPKAFFSMEIPRDRKSD